MDLLHLVEIARRAAVPLVGPDIGRDVAHDVVIAILEWRWHTWTEKAVSQLAEDLARAELERATQHVRLRHKST